MKILITGSSGMLGAELCKIFSGSYEVIGVDIVCPKHLFKEKYKFYEIDLTNALETKKIFNSEKPEFVIHTAAWTDVDACDHDPKKAYSANVIVSRNVAEVAGKNKSCLIFISTDFVFDGKKSLPYTERDSTFPLNIYGKTKLEAEKIIKDTLARYLIVRTSWLYGKNGRNFVDMIVKKSVAGESLRVVGDQTGSPTYTKDLAGALKKVVDSKIGMPQNIFHVSNRGQCSWYEFAKRIVKEIGREKETVVEAITQEKLARPAKRPAFSVLDSGKFQKAAGYVMRPWQEALSEYLSRLQHSS